MIRVDGLADRSIFQEPSESPRGRWQCRSCGADSRQVVLSLGELPLANALIEPDALGEMERRYPLTLVRCEQCGLAQLEEEVPREILFRRYSYFSSYSDTLVRSMKELAARVVAQRHLRPESLVLEIGSNDGYLLRHYRDAGVRILGIEPASNIAECAERQGIPTVNEFFDQTLAARLEAELLRPDVVHAHNVLAHVDHIAGFLGGVRRLLGPESVFIVEVPYVRDLIEGLEFDTIYHEHNCYFALAPLGELFGKCGLRVVEVERIPIHGGSLRVWAARDDSAQLASPAVAALLDEESREGVNSAARYARFSAHVEALRGRVRQMVAELRAEGLRVAGYGAAAKATQLLNYFGLDSTEVEFVADRSPYKQGRYVPGVRIPVVAPEALLERRPDVVLLLAWNFAPEILEQQSEFRRRGGRFLIPIPEPTIV